MSYFQDFPNTNFYNQDLGWLIKKYKELNGDVQTLQQIYDMFKDQIEDVTIEELQKWLDDGTLTDLVNNLIAESAPNVWVYPERMTGDTDQEKLNNAMAILNSNGGTLCLSGNYNGNIEITHGRITVLGGGILNGKITVNYFTDDLTGMFCSIKDITINNQGNTAIEILKSHCLKIINVSISNGTKYGILSNNNIQFNQFNRRPIIDGCHIESDYGIYINNAISGSAKYGVSDIIINACSMRNRISNIDITNGDGASIVNNFLFLSYKNDIKKSNIIFNNTPNITIIGNTLFESGENGILLNKSRFSNVSNNNIIWCGQRVQSSGIKIVGDYEQTGLFFGSINGNNIVQPTGSGIEHNGDSQYISYGINSISGVGNRDHYYGSVPLDSNIYGIKDNKQCVAIGNANLGDFENKWDNPMQIYNCVNFKYIEKIISRAWLETITSSNMNKPFPVSPYDYITYINLGTDFGGKHFKVSNFSNLKEGQLMVIASYNPNTNYFDSSSNFYVNKNTIALGEVKVFVNINGTIRELTNG